jgi:hypothetical protein
MLAALAADEGQGLSVGDVESATCHEDDPLGFVLVFKGAEGVPGASFRVSYRVATPTDCAYAVAHVNYLRDLELAEWEA